MTPWYVSRDLTTKVPYPDGRQLAISVCACARSAAMGPCLSLPVARGLRLSLWGPRQRSSRFVPPPIGMHRQRNKPSNQKYQCERKPCPPIAALEGGRRPSTYAHNPDDACCDTNSREKRLKLVRHACRKSREKNGRRDKKHLTSYAKFFVHTPSPLCLRSLARGTGTANESRVFHIPNKSLPLFLLLQVSRRYYEVTAALVKCSAEHLTIAHSLDPRSLLGRDPSDERFTKASHPLRYRTLLISVGDCVAQVIAGFKDCPHRHEIRQKELLGYVDFALEKAPPPSSARGP
jgi:hypothetical protein